MRRIRAATAISVLAKVGNGVNATTVGRVVGTAVGVVVVMTGDRVPLMGDCVGTPVGIMVGKNVTEAAVRGALVGTTVGARVVGLVVLTMGADVGPHVGKVVGELVGPVVGSAEGLDVGVCDREGAELGNCVATIVKSTKQMSDIGLLFQTSSLFAFQTSTYLVPRGSFALTRVATPRKR